jgi:serine/threonine protein kinase
MGAQNTVFFIEEDGGRTVQGYLREIYFNHQAQPVPVQMIYRVCVDILQALVYLESRGILHRDIKGDSNAPLASFVFPHVAMLSHLPSSLPDVVISFFPDSDAAAARHEFVAKLIDFGLARRHEGSGKMEYDVGRYNAAREVAAEDVSDTEGVGVTEGGDSKLGIAGANTITQHAPECCEAPATKPQRSSRFYSHKSDVWAFGTMVVWELMYCACGANIEDMRKSNSITGRMYNKPVTDKNAEELNAAWDTANVSTDALRERIASKLRLRYTASGPRSEDERRMFETLCDVLQGMCEGNHDIRASAAASLERLCGGTGACMFSDVFQLRPPDCFEQAPQLVCPSRQLRAPRNSLHSLTCANLWIHFAAVGIFIIRAKNYKIQTQGQCNA